MVVSKSFCRRTFVASSLISNIHSTFRPVFRVASIGFSDQLEFLRRWFSASGIVKKLISFNVFPAFRLQLRIVTRLFWEACFPFRRFFFFFLGATTCLACREGCWEQDRHRIANKQGKHHHGGKTFFYSSPPDLHQFTKLILKEI